MKPSTAVRKAAKRHILSPFGGQWQVLNIPLGENYTTSTSPAPYVQALQWRKENVAATALELMGWDEEDTLMVGYYNTGTGTAQDLVERCLDARNHNNW